MPECIICGKGYDQVRELTCSEGCHEQLRGLPMAPAISLNNDRQYDDLAKIVRQNLDMRRIYKIALGREYV